MEGSPASPTSWGVPRALAELPQYEGLSQCQGRAAVGSSHLVPISSSDCSCPASPFTSQLGLWQARWSEDFWGWGGFGASLHEKAAGWQWVLVRGWGSQAAGLLLCLRVSPVQCCIQTVFFPDFIWVYSTRLLVFRFGDTNGNHVSAPRESLFVSLPHIGMLLPALGASGDRASMLGPLCHCSPVHPAQLGTAATSVPSWDQGCPGLTGVPCVPAGCHVSVGARGRSPEQPAP